MGMVWTKNHIQHVSYRKYTQYRNIIAKQYRPISQTIFMLSIAINKAEHVCATVIIKHNFMLMWNHKIVINITLCLLDSNGHMQYVAIYTRSPDLERGMK